MLKAIHAQESKKVHPRRRQNAGRVGYTASASGTFYFGVIKPICYHYQMMEFVYLFYIGHSHVCLPNHFFEWIQRFW